MSSDKKDIADILGLKEVIKVEVFRGHRGYYADQPDEVIRSITLRPH